jgi:hypothetical protein
MLMARPPAPIDQEQRAVLDELAAIYRLVWDQYARYPDDSPVATTLAKVLRDLRARRASLARRGSGATRPS